MPHAIIEHSDLSELGMTTAVLLDSVYEGMLASTLFSTSDVKVRISPIGECRNGPDNFTFIHVTVRILSGRSREQRQNLSQGILDQLAGLGSSAGSISVEVCEMERESYSKLVRQPV
jgi:5-carboxymethyl-2-hydroxymuconate isomerase